MSSQVWTPLHEALTSAAEVTRLAGMAAVAQESSPDIPQVTMLASQMGNIALAAVEAAQLPLQSMKVYTVVTSVENMAVWKYAVNKNCRVLNI